MDSDSSGKRRYIKKRLLTPIILLSKGLTKFISFVLGEKLEKVTEEEILMLVDAGNEDGIIEQSQFQMINNVFEFGDLRAFDVMTHRIDICAVDVNSKISDIAFLAINEGFSRIPIYENNVDTIIGVIVVKDLLCLIGKENVNEYYIKDFMREVLYIPESCPCSQAFKQLTQSKLGIAVVVDEHGGTAGIITLEDIIEEVMGEIQDEYDEELKEINKISDIEYEIEGDTDPDDVMELFGYTLEKDHEYDTIAGFVTDLLGYIPNNSDEHPSVEYNNIKFEVMEIEDRYIKKIKAKVL